MELSAVMLARVLLFIESAELNPTGRAFYPHIVNGLKEKCGFYKFPQKLEDFDEEKGVEFVGGRWGDTTIEAFRIYRNGLLLDTRVSTTESERVLTEALVWGSSQFGIVYNPKMTTRRGYLSQLIVQTDAPILGKESSPAAKLARRAQIAMEKVNGDKANWQPTVLTVHSDPQPRKPSYAALTIQRRTDAAFRENKYYSESPFPTDVHFALLEQLEADIIAE